MRRELKRYASQIAWPTIGVLLVAYFAYHMVQGEHGLITYLRLQAELRAAEEVLTQTAEERARWQRDVDLLRPEHLSLDMLEGRARVMLNHVRPDEVIILDVPVAE